MRSLSFIFVVIFAVSVSAQSRSVTVSFNEGTKLANAGEFERALSNYRAALGEVESVRSDNDFLARLHYNLGVCEYQLNHPRKAIEEFDVAIKMKGGNYSRAFYALGMAESARENWRGAQLAFLEALELDKTNGEAWFDLAFAYLEEGNFAAAEAAFRNSIIHKSIDLASSHNNVGVFLALKGEFSSAEKEFETALKSSAGKLVEARNNIEYCRARDRERSGLMERGGLKITNHRLQRTAPQAGGESQR
jgi:Tfp pilus assembly protein PilF